MASKARRGTGRSAWLVATPPMLFLLVFFAAPSLLMITASLRVPGEFGSLAPLAPTAAEPDAGLTLESYRVFFGDWIYAGIFAKSLLIAAITTVACLALAYPLALAIARSGARVRDLLVLLAILPLASNLLVRVYAWMIILGPLDLLFSRAAVIIGMVYVHLPFMVLPLYANLERHDPILLDAAQDLGASGWSRFWRVTFPLSLPGVWAGAALVFVPVLGMFAIPEILGGTGDWMVGNMIKEAFLGVRDWPFGAMLSIMLTLAVLAIAGLAALAARRA